MAILLAQMGMTDEGQQLSGWLLVRRCQTKPCNDTDGSRADILRRRRFQGIAVAGKTSGSQPCIPMMEPANHWELDDLPLVRRLHLPRFRGVLLQRQVRPATVIVGEIISKNPAQVILANDDHMVDAVSA